MAILCRGAQPSAHHERNVYVRESAPALPLQPYSATAGSVSTPPAQRWRSPEHPPCLPVRCTCWCAKRSPHAEACASALRPWSTGESIAFLSSGDSAACWCASCWNARRWSVCPNTPTMSPGLKVNVGSGLSSTVPSRSTATTEAPVCRRICSSCRVPPHEATRVCHGHPGEGQTMERTTQVEERLRARVRLVQRRIEVGAHGIRIVFNLCRRHIER